MVQCSCVFFINTVVEKCESHTLYDSAKLGERLSPFFVRKCKSHARSSCECCFVRSDSINSADTTQKNARVDEAAFFQFVHHVSRPSCNGCHVIVLSINLSSSQKKTDRKTVLPAKTARIFTQDKTERLRACLLLTRLIFQ